MRDADWQTMASVNLTVIKAAVSRAETTESLFQNKANTTQQMSGLLLDWYSLNIGHSGMEHQWNFVPRWQNVTQGVHLSWLWWQLFNKTMLCSFSQHCTSSWGVRAVTHTRLSTSVTRIIPTPGRPGWTRTSNHRAACWGCLSSAGLGSTSPAATD